MKWYTVEVPCPDCKIGCPVQAAAYSADGELCFAVHCIKCGQELRWQIYAGQLAYLALVADLSDKRVKNERIVPVKPKEKNGFTEDDIRELKKFHIRDEERP